jgi:hypothetical protein
MASSSLCALDGAAQRAGREHLDQMFALLDRAAHVGNRLGDRLRGIRGKLDAVLVDRLAGPQGAGFAGEERGRATEASAMRAETKFCLAASSTTLTPAPAMAMSISLRGMKRR